jgi:molecular chaperone DnaJ
MTQPQREWFEKDYYKILGIKEDATEKEITRAYRKLAKENHPDSHPGREEKFKEISGAYAVLSDAEKRKSYDEVRKMGPGTGGFGGPGSGGAGFPGFGGNADLGDLLGGLFGGGRGRATQTRGRPGPRRGDDLESTLNLSFEEAVSGVTTTVTLVGDTPCSTCNATGAAPGTSPVVCSSCGGRGVVDSNQGFFSFSQPCQSCGGNGMRVETPCPACRGTGNERKPRNVKVRIPAGVDDGQRIRLKSRGGAGRNGGAPGDLYVVVRVSGHSMFGRRGSDLTLTVPITFTEAVLGASIRVPTLAQPVTVKVPAGTKSGRVLRLRGKGAATAGAEGDLLVTLDVVIPTALTEEERTLVEQLAALPAMRNPRSDLGMPS